MKQEESIATAVTTAGLPSLLVEAAHSAAVADGILPSNNNGTKPENKLSMPSQQNGTASSSKPTGDAVAAALAMVSAGNRSVGENVNSGTAALNRAHTALANAMQQKIARATNSNEDKSRMSISNSSTSPGSSSVVANGMSSIGGLQPNASTISAAVSSATSAGSAAHMLAAAAGANSSTPVSAVPSKPPPQASVSPVPRSSSTGSSGGKKKGPPLRRGKWTAEEEAYANRLILEFKAGLLPLQEGTTLRTFLSKLLNCDPMRISKKFVGSNCIGKQVFRRRTADINRLTPEQIQTSRGELSELERRFLERVAQTNRVKSSGVGGNNSGTGNGSATASSSATSKIKTEDNDQRTSPPSPPWLRPPNGFKHGTGAATAAAALSSGTNNRAAAAGRALLQGSGGVKSLLEMKKKHSLTSHGSAGLLALAELQRRQSKQNLLSGLAQSLGSKSSASNLLAAAAAAAGSSNVNNSGGVSGQAMAQIARNASAARIAGLAAADNSMTNLMLKTGLSRDQLSQLAREHRNSSASLSNMMERQSSLDALMSLDFQSLQSIDNLANLIQTGASQVPKSGMKNWSGDTSTSSSNLAAAAAIIASSSGNLSKLANARRLASEGRMESLIRSLSSGNVANKQNSSSGSNATFNNLLQSMQNNLNGSGNSTNNLFGPASALNLANMFRVDSSTGLTALRMQDGLAQRNSSVEDFLSLVASGDIPHQDPHMLNVPLQTVMHTQQQNNQSGAQAAATYLAQQQLLAQAANSGNGGSLSQRIASLGGLANNSSAASLLSQYAASNSAAAAFAQQHQQNRAAQMNSVLAAATAHGSSNSLKRKLLGQGSSNDLHGQGSSKR